MTKSYGMHFDNTDEYYEWAAGTKVNKPFHYAASRTLFGAMALKHGLLKVRVPDAVKEIVGPAVVASTHRSWLDVPVFVEATERAGLRHARPVAKDSLFKHGPLTWAFHQLGAVAVDRKAPNFAGISKAFGAFLEAGTTVNVFTEGTRIKEDTRIVRAPKRIALILAGQHNVPVVPLAIAGVAVDDARHPLWLGKPVVAVFGEPILLPSLTSEEPQTELMILRQARLQSTALHLAQQACMDLAYEIRGSA